MAKRRSEYQINHNNWDEECEQEEGGNFQQAEEGVLKNRVIRVAKRRLPRDQVDSGDPAKKTTSVFSGFSFEKSTSNLNNASTAASTKPIFSFNNTGSTPFSLGSNLATPMSSTAKSIGSSATTAAKTEKSQTFKAKLRELNKSVLNCVKGYVQSESLCILTPIFNDYDKFVKEIEDEERKAMTSTISIATTASATPIKNANNDSSQFKFSFNSAKSTEQSASASSTTANAPLSANSSQTSGFSFKSGATATPATFSGFSFASAAKPANATPSENGDNKAKDADNEDEEDQPPVVEFKPVVEEESIYSKRCKVFVKDESAAFKDRGTGMLYMKKVADDKVQMIVRADTNLGNILLNIIISKGIPAKRNKNNLILVCIPTPDADPKPRQVLVRVAKEDDAIELLEEYEKHQK